MLYRLDPTKPEDQNLTVVQPEALSYDPLRKRVIMFPGGGAYFTQPGARPGVPLEKARQDYHHLLAGTLRMAEQAVEPHQSGGQPPVDVFLYVYEGEHGIRQPIEWMNRHFNKQDALVDEQGQPTPFVSDYGEEVFLKLLLKPGEHLRDLPKDEIKQRVSQFTFIGHSLGSMLVQLGSDYLVRALREANKWSEQEIAEMAKELVTVAAASIARQDMPQPTATQFFFTADNDPVAIRGVTRRAEDKPEQRDAMLKACGYDPIEEQHRNKPKRLQDNRYQIRGTVPETVTWQEMKNGQLTPRTIPNSEGNFTGINDVRHDFRAFLYGVPEIRDHLRHILLNAVERHAGIGDGHALTFKNSRHKPLQVPPQPERQVG